MTESVCKGQTVTLETGEGASHTLPEWDRAEGQSIRGPLGGEGNTGKRGKKDRGAHQKVGKRVVRKGCGRSGI